MDLITLHNGEKIQGEIMEFTRTYKIIRIRYTENSYPRVRDRKVYNKNIASIESLEIGD